MIATIVQKDTHHERAIATTITIRPNFATTQACVTESTYLLRASGGWPAVDALHRMIENGTVTVLDMPSSHSLRSLDFMERFRDIPCDFADASLLVAAEDTGVRRIFTFDKHFYAYRLTNGDHLDVMP